MDDQVDPALHEYYARGQEHDRLAEARGVLEFERTKEIVLRHLPAPPSMVADIGGGPGRYTRWLAERGHRVEHRDLMPLHIDQLRAVADPLTARCSWPPSPAGRHGWTASCDCGSTGHYQRSAS